MCIIGGSCAASLRIWLDTNALAARGLTVQDVESALRAQNVELPAGYVQSQQRDYQVRVARAFETPEQFARLPLAAPATAKTPVVRLGDVARIEIAPEETRRLFRGNGATRSASASCANRARTRSMSGAWCSAEVERIRANPAGGHRTSSSPTIPPSSSTAPSAASAQTLLESTLLVVLVIFLFLGSWRAALDPGGGDPGLPDRRVRVLAMFGFSINLLTLMALVLAIGLVVDDSIVVLENAQRRVDTLGEPPLVAAERGTRQVFFAVVATSAVLVAVFAPLLFVGGYVGRLFIELAVTIAGVVVISAFASLSLSPMMCSKMLRPAKQDTQAACNSSTAVLNAVRVSYRASLEAALAAKPSCSRCSAWWSPAAASSSRSSLRTHAAGGSRRARRSTFRRRRASGSNTPRRVMRAGRRCAA